MTIRIFGPVQRLVVPSGLLAAATLTAIAVDFNLSALGAVILRKIDGIFEYSTFTQGDNDSMALVGRPGVAVRTAADAREPWDDPDFIVGRATRAALITTGATLEEESFAREIAPPEGMILAREATALFFSENVVEHVMGIWFHRAMLDPVDLMNLVIAGRR